MTGRCDLHRRQLAVPRAEQLLRAIVLRSGAQDLSPSTQHHPAKSRPVFVATINHNSGHWVALDVADALSALSAQLRLLSLMVM